MANICTADWLIMAEKSEELYKELKKDNRTEEEKDKWYGEGLGTAFIFDKEVSIDEDKQIKLLGTFKWALGETHVIGIVKEWVEKYGLTFLDIWYEEFCSQVFGHYVYEDGVLTDHAIPYDHHTWSVGGASDFDTMQQMDENEYMQTILYEKDDD